MFGGRRRLFCSTIHTCALKAAVDGDPTACSREVPRSYYHLQSCGATLNSFDFVSRVGCFIDHPSSSSFLPKVAARRRGSFVLFSLLQFCPTHDTWEWEACLVLTPKNQSSCQKKKTHVAQINITLWHPVCQVVRAAHNLLRAHVRLARALDKTARMASFLSFQCYVTNYGVTPSSSLAEKNSHQPFRWAHPVFNLHPHLQHKKSSTKCFTCSLYRILSQ